MLHFAVCMHMQCCLLLPSYFIQGHLAVQWSLAAMSWLGCSGLFWALLKKTVRGPHQEQHCTIFIPIRVKGASLNWGMVIMPLVGLYCMLRVRSICTFSHLAVEPQYSCLAPLQWIAASTDYLSGSLHWVSFVCLLSVDCACVSACIHIVTDLHCLSVFLCFVSTVCRVWYVSHCSEFSVWSQVAYKLQTLLLFSLYFSTAFTQRSHCSLCKY